MIHQLRTAAVGTALAASVGLATAGPLSFAGSFGQDDNVQIFNFAVSSAGTVTLETFGYAGGNDPVRGAVPSGGFDPVFGLFTAAGQLVGVGDDGATRIDPVTGSALDAFLSTTLAPGNYFVALAEYDNFPVGPTFADGFLRSGAGNFTSAFGCSAGKFCDVNGVSRTPNYDLAIAGANVAAAVPEPSTLALMSAAFTALLGFGLGRNRRGGVEGSKSEVAG